MGLEILNAAITLITGIFLICMLQTTFRDSALRFRIGIALIAAGLLCMTLGPLWEQSYVSFAQMLLNIGLLIFVAQLRARQIGWTPRIFKSRLGRCIGIRA